jgi:hypothetical protein
MCSRLSEKDKIAKEIDALVLLNAVCVRVCVHSVYGPIYGPP